ncbi:sugar kinase [Priestia aryabhattai]|uniref:sugar kinase n=1 Tax=Priestia aryabhattai TaxID=412384 RepID=UPI0028824937|nr:sugar kinase [Priestia aryabhattai]MDT0149842.1 sugar kinase [Priestia aryabhattai]MDT0155395.1 sugar kinase [Priestia aryabhattai]
MNEKKIITFGEPLIRLDRANNEQLFFPQSFNSYFGGSEANVAIGLSGFGHKVSFVTGVPNNQMGENYIRYLNAMHVDTSHVRKEEGRLGIYYTQQGFSVRPSSVIYDRGFSVFSQLKYTQEEVENILLECKWFHFSGITAALGTTVQDNLLLFLKECKKTNITVSCDLNYRSKLWSVKEAKQVLGELVSYADVCIGLEPLPCKDTDNTYLLNLKDEQEILLRMQEIREQYGVEHVIHTIRHYFQSDSNEYFAYILNSQGFHKSKEFFTSIVDRVGSGDSFVAGIIHGLLYDEDTCNVSLLNFAVANGIYKCTIKGDNMYISEEAIKKLVKEPFLDIER